MQHELNYERMMCHHIIGAIDDDKTRAGLLRMLQEMPPRVERRMDWAGKVLDGTPVMSARLLQSDPRKAAGIYLHLAGEVLLAQSKLSRFEAAGIHRRYGLRRVPDAYWNLLIPDDEAERIERRRSWLIGSIVAALMFVAGTSLILAPHAPDVPLDQMLCELRVMQEARGEQRTANPNDLAACRAAQITGDSK